MAYNLTNKKILNKIEVNFFTFEINAENECCFYVWDDENATLSDKAVSIKRVNFNLSENNVYNLKIGVQGFNCVAKNGDYLLFKNDDGSIYLVCSTVINNDLNNEFEIVNPSAKAVDCSFFDGKVSYSIKDSRMFTHYAQILDFWLIIPHDNSQDITKEILQNVCI